MQMIARRFITKGNANDYKLNWMQVRINEGIGYVYALKENKRKMIDKKRKIS